MKYRQVGASPLIVSEIALGSWLTFTSGAQNDNAVACRASRTRLRHHIAGYSQCLWPRRGGTDSRAANSAMNGFLNRDWLQPRVLEAVQALRPLAAATPEL